jgi:hypothetical protein
MTPAPAPASERLRLEKELESLVDGMPTRAVEILVQYAAKLRAAYEPQERKPCKVTIHRSS